MNHQYGLTTENLLRSLPISLAGDPKMVALAEAIAGVLAARLVEIDRLRIYPQIETLDEGLLEILAYNFKVDWWDSDYSLEEKRRTLQTSWQVHKTLGTRAAVETALRAIYPESQVRPWFEYGGRPYHFKLEIDLTNEQFISGKPEMALQKIQYYKSLRDHMDEIQYTIVIPAYTLLIGCAIGKSVAIGVPAAPGRFHFNREIYIGSSVGKNASVGVPMDPDRIHFNSGLSIGSSAGKNAAIGVPAGADSFSLQDEIRTGGVGGSHSAIPVPEDTSARPAPTILRTGGVCTILSNLSIGE